MKSVNLSPIVQGVVVSVVTAAIVYYFAVPRAFSEFDKTVSRLDSTVSRIEPLVDDWVKASGTINTEIKAVKDDVSKLDERVRDLETGG